MADLTPEKILDLDQEHIAQFIRANSQSKRLSALVRRLNQDLEAKDEAASELAARALRHMGFIDQP